VEQALEDQFAGKVALATGAGSGMGCAIAILLAKRGAAVTLVGRRENKLADVAAEITAAGQRRAPRRRRRFPRLSLVMRTDTPAQSQSVLCLRLKQPFWAVGRPEG
jgi:NAD(P)-dependent dehydrogenase (short-subunit alcohol dehydrogenase family)